MSSQIEERKFHKDNLRDLKVFITRHESTDPEIAKWGSYVCSNLFLEKIKDEYLEDLKTDEYYEALIDDVWIYNLVNKYEAGSIEEPYNIWVTTQSKDEQDYKDAYDWRLKCEVNERITKLIFDRKVGQLTSIEKAYLLCGGENKKWENGKYSVSVSEDHIIFSMSE